MTIGTAAVKSSVLAGVLSAVGNTPLIELSGLIPDAKFRIFAKLEGLNPGGSTKDRPATAIIRHGLRTGVIRSDTVVIESSSGNMGIGLAQACCYHKLRFICVVDPKTTPQNVQLMKAYGAEVDLVTRGVPVPEEYLQARINRVNELLRTVKNGFWPNQYVNPHNPIAHHTTMHEIAEGLEGRVDYLFCATSTCGTLRGCSEYNRNNNLGAEIIAVDAVGSIIFGYPSGRRLIPGHGASVVPALYDSALADRCELISDLECVAGCRTLVKREALLAGGSSGAVVAALLRIQHEIPPGATCALILADRGERYLDTIYSDSWVSSHFGDVSALWGD